MAGAKAMLHRRWLATGPKESDQELVCQFLFLGLFIDVMLSNVGVGIAPLYNRLKDLTVIAAFTRRAACQSVRTSS